MCLHLIFAMVAKYKGTLLFDFSVGNGLFSLGTPALYRTSIILLYSESTRPFLIDSCWKPFQSYTAWKKYKIKVLHCKNYMWNEEYFLITRLPFNYFYFKSILGNFFSNWALLDPSVSLLGRMASNIFTGCCLMVELCLPTAPTWLVCSKVKWVHFSEQWFMHQIHYFLSPVLGLEMQNCTRCCHIYFWSGMCISDIYLKFCI